MLRMSLVFCCFVLSVSGPSFAQIRRGGSEKTLKLKAIKVAPDEFRLGWGLKGELPTSGFAATLGKRRVQIFDLDGDGAIQPEVDGFASLPDPFIVSLPRVLLFAGGQYRVQASGALELKLSPEDLGSFTSLVADICRVNELRLRAGRPLCVLDLEASQACEKHCDYLLEHRLTRAEGGVSAHEEDPGKVGYSEAGARAGRYSCLAFEHDDYKSAVDSWYQTAWHGAPVVDPETTRFGAALRHGVAMFYTVDPVVPTSRWCHPEDGSRGIPKSFGYRGEIPNPVPGTDSGKGCGMPIYVVLPDPKVVLQKATVKDSRGREVEGTSSCPNQPANAEWPSNSGLALFIPRKSLKPKTSYQVEFELSDGTLVWSFTTE